MFDIGFWEMSLIALVALVVLGPERLPKVARTVGLWVGRARRMVSDVKADIDREIRNSELKDMQELKKGVESIGRDVQGSVSKASESVRKQSGDLDLTEAIRGSARSIRETAEDAAATKKVDGDK